MSGWSLVAANPSLSLGKQWIFSRGLCVIKNKIPFALSGGDLGLFDFCVQIRGPNLIIFGVVGFAPTISCTPCKRLRLLGHTPTQKTNINAPREKIHCFPNSREGLITHPADRPDSLRYDAFGRTLRPEQRSFRITLAELWEKP